MLRTWLPRFCIFGCLLIAFSSAISSDTCTAGKPIFQLTSLSGSPACSSSEVALLWPKLEVTVKSDCTYSLSSNNIYTYPTSFATVTYPGPYSPQQLFLSQEAVSFTYDVNNEKSAYVGNQLVTSKYGTDFPGFSQMLSEVVFPPYRRGPFGSTTNGPANYTYKLQLPSTFQVFSPPNSCTYTYRMTSGPAFGGMKPSSCTAGKDPDCPTSCPSGKYRAGISGTAATTGTTSYICALCPAGTTSAKDGGSCQPCSGSTVASAVGSTSCQACSPPYFPSPTKTACASCPDINYQNPTDRIYDASCRAQECPKGSLPTSNNQCVGGNAGKLCVSKSAAAAAAANGGSKGVQCSADTSTGTAPFGGAILQLVGSDTSKAGCKERVAPLVKWLQGRSTYMGFNLTQTYPSNNDEAYGVQWQVLGSLEGSDLNPWPICGNAHGGPGPQRGLTVRGTALGVQTLQFLSILYDDPWTVLASPGSAAGTIDTTWLRDVSTGICGVTSLNAREYAGGDKAGDVCKMTWKVVSGSILGVSGSSSCPAGVTKVQHPDGTTSCLACTRGYYTSKPGGSCEPCLGKTYTNEWGSVKCMPCNNPFPGTYGSSSSLVPNYFCYSG